jgi:hypothetical protein
MENTDGPTEARRPFYRSVSGELRVWLISLALASPAFLPYVSHFAAPPAGRLPTGFIAYDMPYYVANAREHFDQGRFRLFYSNPFDARSDAPAIYVQPMSLALGATLHATGIPPGALFVVFEFLAAWVCARVAFALYAEIVGLGGWARRLGLVAFFWGGGLLVLAAAGYSLITRGVIERIFRFDPSNGWWFLNFGRNLVFPTEALYHALFFGSVLCLIRRRFVAATLSAFILSVSHPFSGVELLLILATWSGMEVLFVRSTVIPKAFFIAVLALLTLHVGYYLGYLGRFPEHRALMKTWTIAWELDAVNFVPAYALVGALAFWSFRRLDLARQFFAQPRNRLFLTWFLVAFALANHEFAVRPIQPLHFARGYDWTPLFFMAAVPLVGLLATARRLGGRMIGTAAVSVIMGILLLDNAVWLAQFPIKALAGRPDSGITVSAAQLDLYRWFCRDENDGAVVLTDNQELGYLTSVYSPLRSWVGHMYNTPDFEARSAEVAACLESGSLAGGWMGERLLVVVDGSAHESRWPHTESARLVYKNEGYLVYRVERPIPTAFLPTLYLK